MPNFATAFSFNRILVIFIFLWIIFNWWIYINAFKISLTIIDISCSINGLSIAFNKSYTLPAGQYSNTNHIFFNLKEKNNDEFNDNRTG